VPSRAQPDLVPDFAARLAGALRLFFLPVVIKTRDNEPQKTRQNRFHQCQNLDGAFSIDGPITQGPVILVNDVFNSGWTLTIVAALLRQAGCGPVWPVPPAAANPGG
jgi:ATP-dependent DNA helicase RecQ